MVDNEDSETTVCSGIGLGSVAVVDGGGAGGGGTSEPDDASAAGFGVRTVGGCSETGTVVVPLPPVMTIGDRDDVG